MAKSNHIGPHKYELVKIKRLVKREDGKGFKHEVVGARYKCQLPGRELFMPGTKTSHGTIIAVNTHMGERMYHLQNGPNEFARYPQDVMEQIIAKERSQCSRVR